MIPFIKQIVGAKSFHHFVVAVLVKGSTHSIAHYSCSDLIPNQLPELCPPEPIKLSRLDLAYELAVLMAITSLTTNAACSP